MKTPSRKSSTGIWGFHLVFPVQTGNPLGEESQEGKGPEKEWTLC